MRLRLSSSALSGAALVGLINLSLGACSPVLLSEDTDGGTAGASAGEDGNSSGGSSGGTDTDAGEDGGSVPTACVDLVPRVLGVLDKNCAKCHGAGSTAQGGIDYMLDLDALIANGKVKPGLPEESRIWLRMSATDGPMPPLSEEQRPNATDITAVGEWITSCAGVQSCADQPFIPTTETLAKISNDLNTSPEVSINALPFTRYFSLVHLYNAGWCEEEIEIYRQGLSKLVNSLSRETKVVAPVAIDPLRLIYRIDIRDYDWDRKVSISEGSQAGRVYDDVWELIADQNEYTIEYEGDNAEKIKLDTFTKFPVLQADAFVDATSRSPLYYDVLSIPTRRQDLEQEFGINLAADINKEVTEDPNKVARAAFHKSDVSDFHRVIERHEFPDASNRVYWISFDFSSEAGDKNVFVNPLDFKFDGGEIIFNLQNGLQGYMLVNALGNRLNEAPTNIVRDKNQKDGIVRNGISCMGCHSSGMITAQDDLRWEIDHGEGAGIFDDPERDQIRRLYPERADFEVLLAEDTDRFTAAVDTLAIPSEAKDEPIVTTFLAFDEDVKLRRAAAELGLPESDLRKLIALLSKDLNDLLKEDGSIQRAAFTANFAASVCALKLGRTKACPK